jgi:hypothetical protein
LISSLKEQRQILKPQNKKTKKISSCLKEKQHKQRTSNLYSAWWRMLERRVLTQGRRAH